MIGTVKGDLHDIGKNLVGMMLEGAGFQIVDVDFARQIGAAGYSPDASRAVALAKSLVG